ncbi:LamG domain-containing protein [Pseudomaricurvus alcaniphilus]|uniref:LamG domain-containing protein n=1 Tax=Pseudomaricurvus alcaniphilus TaxID=1166482 RepID=UPI0031334571
MIADRQTTGWASGLHNFGAIAGPLRLVFFLPLVLSLLAACSGGSGESTSANINAQAAPAADPLNYTGPAPQTADVQEFKLNLWDNLALENRCGNCHGTGGQAPTFVQTDDVNLAYNAANTIVDLGVPGNSRMVTKVAGGHNCWLESDTVCGDIISNYISGWATATGNAANVVALTAPAIKDVAASKKFPADSTDFTPVHELLRDNCASCHAAESGAAQQPYFASTDIDVAYAAAQVKMDLDEPQKSRLVVRLGEEFHNCWSECSSNASAMQQVISDFAGTIPVTLVDASLVTSKALNLADDGIVASSGGRVETNLIALYEFKAGSGSTAYDTSGVEPATNLNLIGAVDWVGAWGIRIHGGKAQASTADSRKLHNLITATGEYSVEAWVVPDNVTQDGPARIVSYSGGGTARNFTLGQTLYNYDFLNRSSATDGNGQPALSTADADERLQATLQHVVLTYDPISGRRIYVNGQYSGDVDGATGGTLGDWDDSFALVLGSEVSNADGWAGTVRLLAIHNRALSEADIQQNHSVGVGEKFFLLFGISHLVAVPQAFIVFEVQQFDDHGYLFNAPFFTSLDSSANPDDIAVRGLRIGINGREAEVGQAWATLDTTLSADANVDGKQMLSSLGSVVALEQGPAIDEFFLTFDQLGDNSYVRVEGQVTPRSSGENIADQARIGLRGFAEINASMAAVTGVDSSSASVQETFNKVKQQLPTVESVEGFLAAHQMGVTQLAVAYCSSLVGELNATDTSARDNYFAGFDFSATPDQAFDSSGRAAIIDPLIRNLLANDLPVADPDYPQPAPLATQPLPADITSELNNLLDRMAGFCPADCASEPDRTIKLVKAACAAALGSAVILMQ